MTATLLLIVKLAILIAIAVWLADRPGSVEIVWQGYVIEVSFALFVLAIAVLMALSGLFYWLWRALVRTPANLGRSRLLARRERGYEALTQGLVAVAAGDAANARKLSKRATVLLPVDAAEAIAQETALAEPAVQRAMEGKAARKVIVVKNRIVNVVV